MFKYIMVTNFDDHWDRIPGGETCYTRKMLRGVRLDRLEEDAPTLFIKVERKSKRPEKAWVGRVRGFRVEAHRVCFKVIIEKELQEVPPKYRGYKEGWYEEGSVGRIIPEELMIYPPFFYTLSRTTSWEEFEGQVYLLLKLLGIHEVYRFERQKGVADGFFKIGNLAVLYDCTLREGFEEDKRHQIENYCNVLKSGNIDLEAKTVNVVNCEKQVWIITRGTTRLLKKVDDIEVKEVSVDKLIELYTLRLKDNVDEKGLIDMLRSL